MQIEDKVYVAIDYSLTLANGEQVDSSPEGQPLGFIVGTGQIIPGLENQLKGKVAGDKAEIVVTPAEGYGEVNENMFQEIPREQFPADVEIEPGMTFQAQGPQGPVLIKVDALKDDKVVVDLNHPLAGEQLHFDVKVVEVREANAEELAQLEQQQAAAAGGCGCGTADQSNCGSGGCSC